MGLEIFLLGTFQVLRDGESLQGFESQRVRALLAYLVLEADRPHSREALAALLWPDASDWRARRNLSQALSNLRKVLGESGREGGYLRITPHSVQFNPQSRYVLDVTRLEALLDACERHSHRRIEGCQACRDRLERIVGLYKGPLLQGVRVRDALPFEEWLVMRRERLEIKAQTAFMRLLQIYERQGDYAAAEEVARKLLDLAPWLEEAHARLIRLLAVQGHRSQALKQYRTCCKVLARELETEPTAETQELVRRIRAGETDPSSLGLPATMCRLPTPFTPFVGREVEVQAIVDRFQRRGDRLVTIVGPGGCGKTYLAVHAARRLLCAFRDGVYFVSLASLSSAGALPSAIADVLGIPFFGERSPEQQVLAYLRERDLLLVLDNFEHLLPKVGFLEELLQAAPGVCLLITSRAPLHLQAEQVVPLGGLAYPEEGAADWEQYPAVQLFAQQARRLSPDVDPLREEPREVVRLCRLVDGMPLALLLAAAWVRTLSCGEIVARIRENLDFLQVNWPDVPPRHRSLRATFDHSWRLLSAKEREALQGVSVFQGAFDVGAASQVAGATEEVLASLVDKSLVMIVASQHYRLHEQLRQYVYEKLEAHPERLRQILARYLAYYADLVERHLEGLEAGDPEAMAALEVGLEDIRAAWQHALALEDARILPVLTEGLTGYYRRRSRFHEVADLLRRLLEGGGGGRLDDRTRISFQRQLGEAYFKCGRMVDGERYLHDVLRALDRPMPKAAAPLVIRIGVEAARQAWHRVRMPRPAADPWRLLDAARAYERLGQCFFFRSESLPAIYTALRGLNLAERAGVSPDLARLYASMCLGLAFAPQRRLARVYARLTREMIERVTEERARAWALEVLSLYHCGVGEWGAALEAANAAVEIAKSIGDQRRMEEAMVTPALVAHYRGDLERASSMWLDLHRLAADRRDPQVQAWCGTGYAESRLLLGEDERALRWLLRAQTLLVDTLDEINNASCYGGLALAYCRLGLSDRIPQVVDQMIPLLHRAPSAFSMLEGLANFGEACLMLSASESAVNGAALARPLEALTREALRAMRRFAHVFPIGRPRACWLLGKHAWRLGRRRQARRYWRQGARAAQRLGMRYELARLRYELHVHFDEASPELSLAVGERPSHSILSALKASCNRCGGIAP